MKKTKKALASLAIASMALTMVPFNAFASGTVPTRLSGTTAAQTAVAIADQTGWTGTAILASSASYGMVDALTAGPLASYLKAPILLTGAGSALDADTKAELTKLNVKTVYVTSGTAVIKQSVLDELKGMNITVVPLGGKDRAETSVNIAAKMPAGTKVVVANGLQDALSIAAIASAANAPILLTDKDALPDSVAKFLAANPGITASDVIGGTGVISDAVKAKLPSATRHAGMSAYDTNNQVIQDFASSLKFDNVYVANGVTGIDALAGAPLAAQTKSAIVLTNGTVPAAATFVSGKLATDSVVTALGGAAVVSDAVVTGVKTGVVTPPTGTLSVTSVSAVSATSFKVVFNQAPADTAKVTFDVKNLTTPVTVSATWNAAKTEATLTNAANFPEGTYSVAVKNDATDLGTTSVAVVAQKVAKIEITSTKLGVVTDTAQKQTGYATYKVFDQYQNDITVSSLANGLTFQSGVGTVTSKDGLLTLDPSSTISNLMQFATVVITGYDSTTGVSVTATLSTSTQIGTLSDLKLGTLTNADGKVLTDGDNTSVFYASYEATDISGNPTTNYKMVMGGLILHGDLGATGNDINQLTTSNSYVKATVEQDPTDSSKAVIKVVPASGTATLTMDMPTVITAMTWTGKTSTLNTTLKKASAVDTFTVMAPSYSIAVGEAKEIPYSALDQNGVAVTKYDDLVGKVTLSNAHFEKNVNGTAKILVGLADNAGFANDGQQVITATTSTGKYSSLTLNIQKLAKATTLTLDSTILVPNMQVGSDQYLDFGINYGGLTVKDNYGRSFDMVGKSTGGATTGPIPQYNYQVIASADTTTGAAIGITGTDIFGNATTGSAIAFGANGIHFNAANIGTGTVKFQLVDTLETWATAGTVNGVTHTAGQLKSAADRTIIDSKSVTFSVLADKDIKGYTIDTVANPIYAVNDIKTTTGAAITAYDKAYAANPYVYGKTSSGSKVILKDGQIVSAFTDNKDDFNVIVNSGRSYDGVKVVANTLDTNVTASSTNLTVTIKNPTDGSINSVTTPIKSSTATPVASTIVTAVGTYLPNVKLNATGDVADIPATNLLTGKIFGRFDTNGGTGTFNGNGLNANGDVIGRAAAYFIVVDQYGTKAMPLGQLIVVSNDHPTYVNGVMTAAGAGLGTLTLAADGMTIVNQPTVGDEITLTGVTKNGLMKTLKIRVK